MRVGKYFLLGLVLVLLLATVAAADELAIIKLQQPIFSKGKTVLEALRDRHSERVYGAGELSRQELSEILWAAGGINRRKMKEGEVGRTAPSSFNSQAIDIYAFTQTTVYKYDSQGHQLIPILSGDHRAAAGIQQYVATAPLNLVYVVDLAKLHGESDEEKKITAGMDVGHNSENVYLYGASAGLNVIARSAIDPKRLRCLLKLGDSFLPLLGQTVGLATSRK